jgi:hypothetical protein
MNVFLSNGYGIILIIWGLVFEIAGVLAFLGIYSLTKRDQQHMSEVAAELAPRPAAPASAPAQQHPQRPRRAA